MLPADPQSDRVHHLGRRLSVAPRRAGYKHYDIIAVADGVGALEDGALVRNLPAFARTSDPHVWVTLDTGPLAEQMRAAFINMPDYNDRIIETREAELSPVARSRLVRFGFSKRKKVDSNVPAGKGMHLVWNPGEMSRDTGYVAEPTHVALMHFARDVRDFCREQDIPLATSLSGIASALARDKRFWPDPRGRVPTATNERLRPWLPGVFQELRGELHRPYNAVGIDQNSAYHVAAQTLDIPDPTTLFARGYFTQPDTAPIWSRPGDGLYERTVKQPGVLVIVYSAHSPRKGQSYPPCIKPGHGRAAVWTNELDYLIGQGGEVHGIVAAWTSTETDSGMARYAEWAQARIVEATPFRKRWLKPTLHALYGMTAMRPRPVGIHHYRGGGVPDIVMVGGARQFSTFRRDLKPTLMATANVAVLGVLQAEIRKRTFEEANRLTEEGLTVTHIHADGIHVVGDLTLMNLAALEGWSIEPRTNLVYYDGVSWACDQGMTLPGRDAKARKIFEDRRRDGRLASEAHIATQGR